jgi:hypothetical protein
MSLVLCFLFPSCAKPAADEELCPALESASAEACAEAPDECLSVGCALDSIDTVNTEEIPCDNPSFFDQVVTSTT